MEPYTEHPPDRPPRRNGNAGCVARRVTLTPAGFEAVRQYREREAVEALVDGRGDGWTCYVVHTMIGGTRHVWRRRAVQP